MTDGGLDERLAAARDFALEAGWLAMEWWSGQRALGVTFKGRHDFLTQADGAVEALILERLAAAFPDDGFVGEEGGGIDKESLWVVDPIDGTSNFVTSVADWCISIADMHRGVPSIGVIFAPALSEIYIACIGKGATKNGAAMHVAEPAEPGAAILDIDGGADHPVDARLAMKMSDVLARRRQ